LIKSTKSLKKKLKIKQVYKLFIWNFQQQKSCQEIFGFFLEKKLKEKENN